MISPQTSELIAIVHTTIICFQNISAPYDQVYPAEEYDNKDVEDNCK